MYFDRAYIKEMAKKQLHYMGSGSAIGVAFLMALLGGGSSGPSARINISLDGAGITLPGGTQISTEEFSQAMVMMIPADLDCAPSLQFPAGEYYCHRRTRLVPAVQPRGAYNGGGDVRLLQDL